MQARRLEKQLSQLSHISERTNAVDDVGGGDSSMRLAEAQSTIEMLIKEKEALEKEKEVLLQDLSSAIEMKMQLAAAKSRLRDNGIEE
eukprot:scaffold88340_cov24-Tisochrysis_lutea.AAC.4